MRSSTSDNNTSVGDGGIDIRGGSGGGDIGDGSGYTGFLVMRG